MIRFNDNQRGFTVIEIITAAFVFTVIIAGIAGIFVRATYLQRRAFAAEQIQSSTLAALESISRDARVSNVCPDPGICNSSVLEMDHPVKGLIRYSYNSSGGIIEYTSGGDTGDFTSRDVNFTNATFDSRWTATDCHQPKVIISLTAENRSGPKIQIKTQTTVVSRNVEEEFTNSCP